MASRHQHHRRSCHLQKNGLGQVVVVMVPFPAQGHLNQLLQLSRLISAYNMPVHFVGTATHNRQAKLRVHGWDPLSVANIHFHEFPTPPFISPPPDPKATVKFPSHLQPSFDASTKHLREPVAKLIENLSAKSRRVMVIHDSLMGSVIQDVISLPNVEVHTFHSVSAFTIFLYLWEGIGKPFDLDLDAETIKDIPSLAGCFSSEFSNFVSAQHDYMKFNTGRIYNTSKVIEAPYLELLAKEEVISKNKKQWALGPFNPVSINWRNNQPNYQRHECLEWLDKQAPDSVIYVSFGTTTSLADEQIEELAIGLEKSQQKFIWVLRDADKGNVFAGGECRKAKLPKGYEERVNGKGFVVTEWAPQLEILAHSATAGFMSHCGWNSCLESISMGVPIAAWPMHSDQPRNALLVTKLLKIGTMVKNWAPSPPDGLVTSSTIEGAVKRLMASLQGVEMRRRAKELGCAVRQAVAEGGVTRDELDSFIAYITR